jgi:hypothetical protein
MTSNAAIDEITAAALQLGVPIVSSYTDEEVRNLQTILRWGELYNIDPAQMVTECYAPDCTVEIKGTFTYHGHHTFVALEKGVHQSHRTATARPRRSSPSATPWSARASSPTRHAEPAGAHRSAPC